MMLTQLSQRQIAKLALIGVAAAGVVAYRRYQKRHRFTDKVVVITGGSRGLGLEIARRFAREGARLAICTRTQEDLDRAAEELSEAGSEVFAVACDITQHREATGFIEKVIERWGTIDV